MPSKRRKKLAMMNAAALLERAGLKLLEGERFKQADEARALAVDVLESIHRIDRAPSPPKKKRR